MDKELKKAAEEYGESNPILHFTADGTEKDVATPMFDFMTGANWQKGRDIDKACEFFYHRILDVGDVEFSNIENFINDFKKYLEEK